MQESVNQLTHDQRMEYTTLVSARETLLPGEGGFGDIVATEIYIEPPLSRAKSAVGKAAMLGVNPHGVEIELIGSTAERTSFLVTASAAARLAAQQRTAHTHTVASIAAERLSAYANGLQEAESMAKEQAFPSPLPEER